MTGVALASAAAVVAAVPAVVPTSDVAVASSSLAPLAVSTAKYGLTSISEITTQGINDAYWFGWGGFLNADTPYYQTDNPIYVSGLSGVAYYLIDCATSDNCSDPEKPSSGLTLDNYFFEAGGVPAVLDVAVNQIFGEGSVPGLLADTIFKWGTANTINALLVSAATALPTFNLGPVKVGGGILANLYFYGSCTGCQPVTEKNPDGSLNYGTPGLSAVLSYIVTSISDALPSTSSSSSSAAAAAKTATLAATTTETVATGETKPADTTTEAGTTTEAAPKATGGFKKDTAVTTSSDATVTPAASTESAPTTDTTSTDTTSTDTKSTETTSADSTDASTGTLPKATPTVKAPKTAKSENPLAKIGQKISDAISGKKADKSDSGSSSDAGSGGSGASGGSAKG